MTVLSYDFTAQSIQDPISIGGEWVTAVGAGAYIIDNAGSNNAASRVSDLQHASNISDTKATYGSKQYAEVVIGANTAVGYSLGPGCFMNGDNSYFIAIQSIGGVTDNRVYKNVAGSYTNLSWTGGVTINIGDKVGLLVEWTGSQTNISVYHNSTTYDGDGFPTDGQVVTPFADTSLSSGQAGLVARNTSNTNQAFVSSIYTAGATLLKTITSITDPIVDGSTGNSLSVADFTGDITSLTLRDNVGGTFTTSMTITSGTGTGPYTFSAPDISANRNTTGIAGMPFPSTYWGANTCRATASDGTDTAVSNTNYTVKSGWAVIDFNAGLDTTTLGTVQYGWTGGAPAQYDQLYYDTYGGLVDISADGIILSYKTTGTIDYQYFDQSDGKWKYSYLYLSSVSTFYTWVGTVISGSDHLTDKWMGYLDSQAVSKGSLNDRWYEWLTSLGYTQHSLNDKIKAWEADNL